LRISARSSSGVSYLPQFMRHRSAAVLISTLLIAAIGLLCLRPFALTVGLLGVVSAGLVVIASANADAIVPLPRVRPILLWIGSRSFATYLAHVPCFWATREIMERLHPDTPLDNAHTLTVAIVALVLIVLASEATYRLIENPLRNLGRVLADRAGLGQNTALQSA
jgi:peptidoglycan/LPS O-acetylase OafA/YrhL